MLSKPKLFAALFLMLFCGEVFADIAPNPIIIKGIVPARPVNIQMVSEVVTADVGKDSSFVTCVFNMRNFGNAQDIDIGFPIMNFYLFEPPVSKPSRQLSSDFFEQNYLNQSNKNQFEVFVSGVAIKKIGINVPKQLEAVLSAAGNDRYKLLQDYENQNKPWYLWRVHFDKQQSLQIVVKYRLPSGSHRTYNFFNYLLSTGAGWKGKIESAKVIVNFRNIPKDQIISISPGGYKQYPTQLVWHFKDIEPTIKNDILVEYERVKGEYGNSAQFKITYIVDGKVIKYTDFKDMPVNNMASVKVDRDTQYKDGAVRIYTKNYVFKAFLTKVKPINLRVWRKLSTEIVTAFPEHFTLEVDKKKVAAANMFSMLHEINTAKKIAGITLVHRCILITTAN
ncbi:MAG: hypothetical protein EOP47_19700 [Sphingobacteriaceae bacterium]|nr:MAG: hypothetical protein EOP47_19700 [Sphingobacteriaceae bacterium]